MATFLRTTVKTNLGITPQTVLTVPSSSSYTIIGCNLANKTADDVTINISITDALSVTGSYVSELTIRAYNSAKIITNGEKLILAGSCTMTVTSDTNNSIDAVISYAEVI
jgi:hypothetical protein